MVAAGRSCDDAEDGSWSVAGAAGVLALAGCGDDGGGGGAASTDQGATEGAKKAPTLDASKGAKGTITMCAGKDTSGALTEAIKLFNKQHAAGRA